MDKGRVVSSPLGQICGGPRKLQCENGLECAREGNIHRGDEHSKLNKKVFGICKRRGQVGTSCGPTFPWSCDPGLVCKHKVQGDSGLCIIQGQNATRTLPKPLNDSQKPIIQSETSQKVEKKTACSSSHPCEVGYICTPNGLDPSEEQGTCQRAGTLGTPCMIGSEHPPCDSRLVCSLTQSGLTVGIGICQERSSKHILDDKMMKSVVESSVRRTSNLEVVLDSPKLHKGRRRGKYVRKLHRRIFPKR
ncbi:hypothetical protein K7432_016009 [Basidiobolus ranarum]|uniref:Uncharacterized protein n=1 Tax=Basidiobolus ranarum TaxID=34480 RepID=A0ABR2VM81_9FUNG